MLKLNPRCVRIRVGKWSPTSTLMKTRFPDGTKSGGFDCERSAFACLQASSALSVHPVLLQGPSIAVGGWSGHRVWRDTHKRDAVVPAAILECKCERVAE